jgi:hypothetical protein
MFCPQCGISQSEEMKFCKTCRANLNAIRQAVTTRDKDEKFDWSKTWVAEMLLSEDEHKKRKREQESSFAAEKNRYNEIKAGVITSCVGTAIMIFLYIFMQGLIASGIDQEAAAILGRVWIAGIIPFLIGLGLVFNGVVVSKKLVALSNREFQARDTGKMREQKPGNHSLSSPDWSPSDSPRPSVTENTTRELRDTR